MEAGLYMILTPAQMAIVQPYYETWKDLILSRNADIKAVQDADGNFIVPYDTSYDSAFLEFYQDVMTHESPQFIIDIENSRVTVDQLNLIPTNFNIFE